MDFFSVEMLTSLLSLMVMLIVLDVDNVIFLSILTGSLPPDQHSRAQRLGLLFGAMLRGGMLVGVGYLATLEQGLFEAFGHEISGKDLLVLAGGLFLMYKSVKEIHQKLEGPDENETAGAKKNVAFGAVMTQVVMLNAVFSVDSVVTAVGMVGNNLPLMLIGMGLSMTLMYFIQKPLARFVDQHPTTKILALAFLLLIGSFLIIEAIHFEVPKGYIYFAMAFSLLIELMNIRFRKKSRHPVRLHGPHLPDDAPKPSTSKTIFAAAGRSDKHKK